ncbi:hypothetical protein [Streptomyces sp. NPDC058572]|uniref:Rv1733c family protein n=1 Tax=Streptomyces sp. NPDC058572 TaxID=3346546 RepID=UPI003652E4EC
MRAAVGLWRWRHNPLCRATDLLEAWVAFAAALLLVTAVPVAGWTAGSLSEESLRESARVQRLERTATKATVVRPAPHPKTPGFDPETGRSEDVRSLVVAKWTAPDGSSHTGTVTTRQRTARPGDTFTIWTDSSGLLVHRPMDPASVRVHAALAGSGAALIAGGLVECARRLVVWGLVRHRLADLDRAWAAVGPDWGRTGAGS